MPPVSTKSLASLINESPTFASLEQQVRHEAEVQAMRWQYLYLVTGNVVGQTAAPFTLQIEQGTDFLCEEITGSAFSYAAAVPTTFPIPNSGAVTAWAGRGLTMQVTDSRAGRELFSGFVPFELFASPGYGLNFQQPLKFKYFFLRNSRIRFDVRNLDAATRTHAFSIVLKGYKVLSAGC